MFLTKNMVDIVLKLLPTNGTDDMILPWFGLINAYWMLLKLVFLPSHVLDIIYIFLIQENSVLFSKLALFLKLEY